MALRRGSGRPQLKLTRRNILIAAGFFVGLVVLIVVLYFTVLQPSGRKGRTTAEKDATAVAAKGSPVSTRDVASKPEPSPAGVGDATQPPKSTAVAQVTQDAPAATRGIAAQPQPTAADTLIPAPAGTAVVTGASPTPLATGGGELPASSSGLPWMIPIGALLLVVAAWWRWRRAQATSQG
jgi:hypothetical protein